MDNATIATCLDEYAGLLELAEASPFGIRAYRRAAELIRGTPAPVAELVRSGRAREVHGIGAKTEARILAALERGADAPVRPLLLHRSRALVDRIADALGGVPAGDSRRWRDASSRLAVAVAAGDPDPVRRAFMELP